MPDSGKPSLGEISTIRDILMGEALQEYNTRIDSLSEQVKTAEAQMEKMQTEHEAQLVALRSQMEKQLTDLKQQLQGKQDDLQEQIAAISKGERQRLGQLLSEIGQQISNS
jgi:hypothetical protein